MSLIKQVSAAIIERGTGTSEDILHLFPHVSAVQVRHALANACRTGQLRSLKHGAGLGRGKGRLPTLYGPPQADVTPPLNRRMPVNSVWALAA
jgi:hypothetical protein